MMLAMELRLSCTNPSICSTIAIQCHKQYCRILDCVITGPTVLIVCYETPHTCIEWVLVMEVILPIRVNTSSLTTFLPEFAGVLLPSQICIGWACWIEGIRETHLGISFYINTSSRTTFLPAWVAWCCWSLLALLLFSQFYIGWAHWLQGIRQIHSGIRLHFDFIVQHDETMWGLLYHILWWNEFIMECLSGIED